MTFYLLSENIEPNNEDLKDYQIIPYEVLNAIKAESFLKLQAEARDEISEGIHLLTKKGITEKFPMRIDNLWIYLIYHQDSLIGYGYSHDDEKENNVCKIDTIYIQKKYRKNGLGEFLVRSIITHNFNVQKNIKAFKAITQTSNNISIRILKKIGFKDDL